MNRHESREQAFIFLFESTFGTEKLDEIIEFAKISRDVEISDFAKKLFIGVKYKQDELDVYIEKHLNQWKKNRLSRVTISILRLAVYEMLFENDIPVNVSISEAVELSKKYSDKENTVYINGVLGSISRSIEEKSSEKSDSADRSIMVDEQC